MFKGIQKVTLIDYPGLIASTVFTGGCNFRCRWCHNWKLVEPDLLKDVPDIPQEEIQDFLLKRKGKIQGVCITGGEPTIWGKRLTEFIVWCRNTGFLVKLDTNGYLPELLAEYIREKRVDFIAMDVKNSFEKYAETAGLYEIDDSIIKKSIDLIKQSGIPHQFRTTLVPELVNPEDIRNLSGQLGEEIILQEYRKNGVETYAANE